MLAERAEVVVAFLRSQPSLCDYLGRALSEGTEASEELFHRLFTFAARDGRPVAAGLLRGDSDPFRRANAPGRADRRSSDAASPDRARAGRRAVLGGADAARWMRARHSTARARAGRPLSPNGPSGGRRRGRGLAPPSRPAASREWKVGEFVLPRDELFETEGLRLHYLDWGSMAGPAPLFLHGGRLTAHPSTLSAWPCAETSTVWRSTSAATATATGRPRSTTAPIRTRATSPRGSSTWASRPRSWSATRLAACTR